MKYFNTVGGVTDPVIDCENTSDWMVEECADPASYYDGLTVEQDWMSAFWDLHTDPVGSTPAFTDILNILGEAYDAGPWTNTTGYDYMVTGAANYNGGTWSTRFLRKADEHSVDH